jgi:ADP-heptose:LPS heptosyltransferase
MSAFESVLVVRLSAMGDVIHALPVVTALRRALPRITLGWLIEERWSELLCTLRSPRSGPRSPQRPLVDRVHSVDTAGWRRSPISLHTWQQMAVRWSEVRGIRYDAVIDFQGAIRSALFASWSGAPVIIGGAQPRENAASMFYTSKILTTSSSHVVEQGFELARVIDSGLSTDAGVELPVDLDAETKVGALLADVKNFAILNPGAGWGAKRWPVERYAEVAREFAANGLTSFINYGPGEEELASAVEIASQGAAWKVTCSISELIALTRRARMFVGGDTGPLHLAAALRIPVVAIFGPTNPARNGPFRAKSIVLRSANSVTDHSRFVNPELGLLEISASQVVAAARALLNGSGAGWKASGVVNSASGIDLAN